MTTRTAGVLAFVLGCGAARAPSVEVPTVAPVTVAPSPELEPRLPAAKCSIGGSTPSLAGDGIALCGKRGAACFGRLRANDGRGARVTALHLDDTGAGELDLARGGVTVHAIVAASGFAFHAAQLELVDRYFVPGDARLRVVRVTGDSVVVAIDPGSHVAPTTTLGATWPCAKVSLDPPEATLDDVIAGLDLNDTGDDVASVVAAPKLRVEPAGPVVATLHGEIVARIVEKRPQLLHVVIETDGGFVVGWVDAAEFSAPQLRGRRARAPRLYQGATHVGRKCAHAVRILARVGTDVVHVATIDAGEAFDPTAARERLAELFDVGEPPTVDPWIPAAQLGGCAER